MRMRSVVVAVSVVLLIGLLAPAGAWAKRITAGGSVEVTGSSLNALSQVVATLITANPGLEKTIVQQLPLANSAFVAPFFINEEQGNPGQNDIGTTLVLTNTSEASLGLTVILYNLDGSVLVTSQVFPLQAHETKIIPLSSLVP